MLTAFVVPKIQDLKVNPALQSVYYQSQSVQMLDQISQQLASVGSQVPTNFTPPSPYPTFRATPSDRRVNIFWLISLVCSLSAALLATLVQQWVRSYIRKSSNPLKTARIRLFLLEGTDRIPMVAEVVPGLIHISLILFFWGLGDLILHIDKGVFVATVVPLVVCVSLYLYCVVAPIWKPQSPYRTPFSGVIWYLIRNLYRSPYCNRFVGKVVKLADMASMATRQEKFAMEETDDRKKRDVRAIQWLVDNINGSNEMQTFILAIPGSFNQKWGRDVWKGVVSDDKSTSIQIQPLPGLPSSHEGTTVDDLCRCVRFFFETFKNEGYSMDSTERRMHVRGCVETAASLVCCTGLELDRFGDVGEVLSQLGDKEGTNNPSTIESNPMFSVRWTCLSLVAIRKTLDDEKLQEWAKFALDGIARFQEGHGDAVTKALNAAQRIDGYLKKAWAPVVQLHLAFEPWSQNRTKKEIKGLLKGREEAISELERIANQAADVEDLDWRISLLLDTMDEATHKLARRLPGVFFNERRRAGPVKISEAFDFKLSSVATTPVPPQLIYPGQQIQSLCTLGRKARDIIEGQDTEMNETLNSLESLREIPSALRELNCPMERQIWRLLDLRDGGGFGFTIELFFLALRQLPSTSISSELKKVFYTGTFKVITSNWEKRKGSAGTQRVLLDLLCDLVIRRRGVFSDFPYPSYIVEMLLNLVGKMVNGHEGKHRHINSVIQELQDDNLLNRMDNFLRQSALTTIGPSSDTHSEDLNPANTGIVRHQIVGGVTLWGSETGEGGQGSAEGRN